MRAKTVNETINFERGKDPKVALGFRTYDLWDIYYNDNMQNDEWQEFLETTFIGKKVEGFMAMGDDEHASGIHVQTTGSTVIAIKEGDSDFPDFSFITIEPGKWVHNEEHEYEFDVDEVWYYVDMDDQRGKTFSVVG